jgi:hypothetical protein
MKRPKPRIFNPSESAGRCLAKAAGYKTCVEDICGWKTGVWFTMGASKEWTVEVWRGVAYTYDAAWLPPRKP